MKYFAVFYMNLMFSALSEDDQIEILDKCMSPLLEMAEDGLKYNLNISGASLELVEKFRPHLISRLKKQIINKQIELVGNGYSQIIQPNFSHTTNHLNQFYGKKVYKSILGIDPMIATVNEQAFSVGSCQSFLELNYKSILMELENVFEIFNYHKNDKFIPSVLNIGKKEINVIWSSTLAFQKFQRYVHGDISFENYIKWIDGQSEKSKGYYCIYSSDAEIFGFRPKRYGTEAPSNEDEWERVRNLLTFFFNNGGLVHASEVSNHQALTTKEITSVEYPIVVKKQKKYNINRWSVTGRDDYSLNSDCYKLSDIAWKYFQEGINTQFIKDFLQLCSSDLRTHIETKRWEKANLKRKKLLGHVPLNYNILKKDFDIKITYKNKYYPKKEPLKLGSLNLDTMRGGSIISWEPCGSQLLGFVEHGTFPEMSLATDYYSGTTVVEEPGKRKFTDFHYGAIKTHKTDKKFEYFAKTFDRDLMFMKKVNVKSETSFSISQIVKFPKRRPAQVKIMHITLLPTGWHYDSLYYKSKLGGDFLETFYLRGNEFDQGQILNSYIGGTNGFTSTEGLVIIGDSNKELKISYNPKESFLISRISQNISVNGLRLVRLIFVCQDFDETFFGSDVETIYQTKFDFEVIFKNKMLK